MTGTALSKRKEAERPGQLRNFLLDALGGTAKKAKERGAAMPDEHFTKHSLRNPTPNGLLRPALLYRRVFAAASAFSNAVLACCPDLESWSLPGTIPAGVLLSQFLKLVVAVLDEAGSQSHCTRRTLCIYFALEMIRHSVPKAATKAGVISETSREIDKTSVPRRYMLLP